MRKNTKTKPPPPLQQEGNHIFISKNVQIKRKFVYLCFTIQTQKYYERLIKNISIKDGKKEKQHSTSTLS